jgi:MFS transporter, DHA1 family, inner membrane transport protein
LVVSEKRRIKSTGIIVAVLTAVHFIHLVDFVVMMPLGPALMKLFDLTPSGFSALVSVYNIASGVVGIVFSFYSNLFQKKYALLVSLIGLGVCTIMTGLSSTSEALFISRLFTGLFGGMLNPLVFALVADLVPYKERGKAMGWIMSGFSLASVFGVPLGLWLNDEFGLTAPFFVIGVISFIVAIFCGFFVPKIYKAPQTLKLNLLIGEMKEFFKRSSYKRSFVIIFILSGSMFLLIPLLSPFAVSNMGIKQEELKFMYLIGGVFTIFTARLFGVMTDRYGPKKVFYLICFLSFFPILVFTQSGEISFFSYIVIGSLFMSLVSGRMIPAMTLISGIPNASDRNRFMGLINSLRGFGSAIFAFLAGLIVVTSSSGQLINFNYVGLLAIAVSIIAIILLKNLKG